jgi:tetratricopeptide (TPR) repeat protein
MSENERLKPDTRRRNMAVFIALTALAFFTYTNSITGDFTFDDVKIVKENPAVRSPSSIPKIFANFFTYKPFERQGMLVDPSYRPIRSISYILDYQFTKESPIGYHISNILYHILASFLLFILLLRFGANFWGAALTSALFCTHPVNSEAVSYITGRKETLCAIFLFASLLTYLSYREKPSLPRLILIIVFFLLSLLSKEMALSLFGILIVFEILKAIHQGGIKAMGKTLFSNLKKHKLFLPLALIFVLCLAYGLFSTLVKSPSWTGEDSVSYWGGSLITAMLSFARVASFYLRLIVVPYPLSADYSYNAFPPSHSLFSPITTLPALIFHIAMLALAVLLSIRRKFIIPFAILVFYTTLVPVSGIVPTPERVAERFLYIPLLSCAILAAFGISRLFQKKPIAVFCLILPLLVLYLSLTVIRNRDWQNNETLFTATLRYYPNCARAHYAVGEAKLIKGDYDNALVHFERALELLTKPQDEENWMRGIVLNARFNRASVLLKKKRTEEAIKELESLLKENDIYGRPLAETPEFLHIRFNLAGAYLEMNRLDESESHYKKVLELAQKLDSTQASDYVTDSLFHIGQAKMLAKNFSEASDWFRKAAESSTGKPKEVQMRYYEALALYEAGKYQNAFSAFNDVISLASKLLSSKWSKDGDSLDIENILKEKRQSELMAARSLRNSGNIQNALKLLSELRKRYPDWWLVYFDEAQLLSAVGRLNDAEQLLLQALSLSPDNQTIKESLVAVRLRKEISQQEGLELPKRIANMLDMAKALLKNNEREKAKELLEKVLSLGASVPAGAEESFVYLSDAHITLIEEGFKEISSETLAEAKRYTLRAQNLVEIKPVKKAFLWRRLATLYEKADLTDEAIFCWQRVLENNQDYLGAHYNLASLLLKKKRTDEAQDQFNKSIEQGYKVADSHYHIGKILLEKDDYKAAADMLRKALENSPDENLTKKIQELMEQVFERTFQENHKENK